MNSDNPKIAPAEFERIAVLIKSLTGMNYGPGKEGLVEKRLIGRLRALGKNSFSEYFDFVESEPSQQEMVRLVDLLTTNKTSFFRENAHFEFLSKEWIPKMAAASPRQLSVWSSACSSGQEPYSIAMHLTEELSSELLSRTTILATDLSTEVLSEAKYGVYSEFIAEELSRERRSIFLERSQENPRNYRVRNKLRGLIRFQQLNLMNDWPMAETFDVIFCCNLMMYFDKMTQEKLVNRFYKRLAKGGYLLIGHAENLSGLEHPFTCVKPAIWQK